MTATATSKDSYRKITDLGNRQQAFYRAVTNLGSASNRQIAKYLDVPVNEITPRCKELRDLGFIVENGKQYDYETGRNVTMWCIKDPAEQRLYVSKDVTGNFLKASGGRYISLDDDTDKFGHSFGVANG